MQPGQIKIVAAPGKATGAGSRFVPRRRRAPPIRREGPLRIALIEPRYEPSYYGLDFMLPLLPGDARASYAGGALPLLAAFVHAPHEVTLFVEDVEPLDFERLKAFDIVGMTGMIVQRRRMIEILDGLADHPGWVLVGGPYASVDESFFDGRCDVLFAGEADTSWPEFLASVARDGSYLPRYEQAERTDMTALPLPRYDLLEGRRFLAASVQFSRGCPFLCEFCDIITIFGRVPRAKTPEQVIAEFEALLARGLRTVFLVDDNFIGNKKLARELLLRLVDWQQANGYPLRIGTEASINLADEPELLDLMYRANFRTVFIGLETPNMESLAETRKVQNVRGDGMVAKVDRVREAGLVVEAGFMLGFDNDGPDIFERQAAFISETRVARAAISMLTAIPSTPLFDRLASEGRLRLDDANCNFEPLRMSRQDLSAGYLALTRRMYEAHAFFGRIFDSWASSAAFRDKVLARARRDRRPGLRARVQEAAVAVVVAGRLLRSLARDGELRLAADYLSIWRDYRRQGVPGIGRIQFVQYAALHWHCYKYYKQARSDGHQIFNTYGFSQTPALDVASAGGAMRVS